MTPEEKKRIRDSFKRWEARRDVWLQDVDADRIAARLEVAITTGEQEEAFRELDWVEYTALSRSPYTERIRILPGEGSYKHLHFQGYVVPCPKGSPPWSE